MKFFVVNHSRHGGAPKLGAAIRRLISSKTFKGHLIYSEMRSNIFLTYSSKDEEIGEYLAKRLLAAGFEDGDLIIANSIESAAYILPFEKDQSKRVLYVHELEDMVHRALVAGRFKWGWLDKVDQVWFACEKTLKVFACQSPRNKDKFYFSFVFFSSV